MSLTLIRTLAVTSTLMLGAAACGGGDGATETGSADTNAIATLDDGTETDETTTDDEAGDTSTADAPDDPELAYALYDECMAEQGFDFSTSFGGEEGGSGVIEIEGDDALADPQAQDFDPEDFDEAFDTANATCEKHLANVDSGFDLDPEQQALFEDAQIEWAQCMRDAGFDIPEMDGDGAAISFEVGGDETDPQSGGIGGNDFDFEAFEEAAEGCESAFDAVNDIFENEGEG